MDLNEINQTIERAIKGEKNEFSDLILKSNQGDDITNKDIILPFFIGVVSFLSIINLIIYKKEIVLDNELIWCQWNSTSFILIILLNIIVI